MKESILIEMRNKVDALTRVIQQIIYDINETKDLSRGTLEVLKKLPGYKKAVDELKTEIEKVQEIKKTAEVKQDKKLDLNVE
jgi:gas vesicle protein